MIIIIIIIQHHDGSIFDAFGILQFRCAHVEPQTQNQTGHVGGQHKGIRGIMSIQDPPQAITGQKGPWKGIERFEWSAP